MSWLDAVALVSRRAWEAGVEWMLVGSAASAFQGVDIEPADVEVLVRTPTGAAILAGHLHEFAAPTPTGRDPRTFLSSHAEPLLAYVADGATWTVGRWPMEGVHVEIAHLAVPDAAALVETRGTRVWDVRRDATVGSLTVPVVPLEVQLATAFVREDKVRRAALAQALAQRGSHDGLLAEALRGRGFTPASVASDPELLALLPARLRPPGYRTV